MRIILFIAIAIGLASCVNNMPKTADTKTETKVDTTAMPKPTTTAANTAHVKMDPVCEMPYDKSWTDQTIYNSDTLTFCSEVCKKTFLARPKKYLKNI